MAESHRCAAHCSLFYGTWKPLFASVSTNNRHMFTITSISSFLNTCQHPFVVKLLKADLILAAHAVVDFAFGFQYKLEVAIFFYFKILKERPRICIYLFDWRISFYIFYFYFFCSLIDITKRFHTHLSPPNCEASNVLMLNIIYWWDKMSWKIKISFSISSHIRQMSTTGNAQGFTGTDVQSSSAS